MTAGTLGRNRYGTARVIVEAQIELAEPSADQGLVTWFEVRVVADFQDADEAMILRARVARVHVGAALEAGEPLRDILDADSSELAALYPVFFRISPTRGAPAGWWRSKKRASWCAWARVRQVTSTRVFRFGRIAEPQRGIQEQLRAHHRAERAVLVVASHDAYSARICITANTQPEALP